MRFRRFKSPIFFFPPSSHGYGYFKHNIACSLCIPSSHQKMGKKPPAAKAISGDEELHSAARSGDLKAVQAICSANPLAVNSRDRHSRTPLHLAAWSGHAEVVNYLCKNKADAGAAAMDDMGAIHFASQKGHLEVIKILVTCGVSVKSSNRKGLNALHYAVQGSNLELVKYLLKKGANKDLKNKAGKTAVDLASNEEIRKLLLEFESSKKVLNCKDKADTKPEESDSNGEEAVDEGTDETLKRKNEDGDEEKQEGSKKSKVALNHLLAEDDAQEEEEDQ